MDSGAAGTSRSLIWRSYAKRGYQRRELGISRERGVAEWRQPRPGGSGPALATLCGDPKITHIVIGGSLPIVLNNTSVLHRAVRIRAMRFSAARAGDRIARITSIALSVALAWQRWGCGSEVGALTLLDRAFRGVPRLWVQSSWGAGRVLFPITVRGTVARDACVWRCSKAQSAPSRHPPLRSNLQQLPGFV
jgi:hypothetical protein